MKQVDDVRFHVAGLAKATLSEMRRTKPGARLSAAYEQVARTAGYKDWNTLSAALDSGSAVLPPKAPSDRRPSSDQVKQVLASVVQGSNVLVRGRSGSGKTSLLRTVWSERQGARALFCSDIHGRFCSGIHGRTRVGERLRSTMDLVGDAIDVGHVEAMLRDCLQQHSHWDVGARLLVLEEMRACRTWSAWRRGGREAAAPEDQPSRVADAIAMQREVLRRMIESVLVDEVWPTRPPKDGPATAVEANPVRMTLRRQAAFTLMALRQASDPGNRRGLLVIDDIDHVMPNLDVRALLTAKAAGNGVAILAATQSRSDPDAAPGMFPVAFDLS